MESARFLFLSGCVVVAIIFVWILSAAVNKRYGGKK